MSQLTLSAILQIVDQATKPLKAIRQQSDVSSDSIDELKQSIDRLNHTMQGGNGRRYNQALQETRQQTSLVRSATQQLKIEYDHVGQALSRLIDKSNQWSDSLAKSRAAQRQQFKNLAITGAVAGAGFYQFLKPAIEFEKQMSGVQAVLDLSKTSEDMKMLTADARKWGASSSFSPAEAAKAQYNLGSAGFNPAQIHDSLGGTLQLAEAGQVDLDMAASIAAGTLNGFGLAAKEITRVNDVLLQATNATATSVAGMGETMKYVAPIAKLYGSSIEQTTAMTGILGDNKILDTQAGTSLRSIYTRFAAPPKEAEKAFNKLNVKTADSKGNLRDISDVLAEIREKTSKLGNAQKIDILKDIAGQEAVTAMGVLVDSTAVLDEKTGQTVNRVKELTKQLEMSKGAAARAAAILKDNLAGDIENLGGAWQDLSISVMKALDGKGGLRGFIKQIAGVIDRVKVWVDNNQELVRTIASLLLKLLILKVGLMSVKFSFSLVFGAIFSIIAGITKLAIVMWLLRRVADKLGLKLPSRLTIISKTIGLVSRAFIFLSQRAIPLVIAGLRAMAIGLLTNPLTLIIALIAVVALAVYRYWGPIKAFFEGFWDGLTDGFAATKQIIDDFWQTLKDNIEPLQPTLDWLNEKFTIFKGVLNEMLTPFEATNEQLDKANGYGETFGLWVAIVTGALLAMKVALIAVTAIQGIITFLTMLTVGFSSAAVAAWAFLAPFLPIIILITLIIAAIVALIAIGVYLYQNWDTIKAYLLAVWESIKASIASAIESLKTKFVDFGNAFKEYFTSKIQAGIDNINKLIAVANKIPGIEIPSVANLPTTNGTTNTAAISTQPVKPIASAAGKSAPVTNHFTAPNVVIHGATDPHTVGVVVDQKLAKWQRDQDAAQRRNYSDKA